MVDEVANPKERVLLESFAGDSQTLDTRFTRRIYTYMLQLKPLFSISIVYVKKAVQNAKKIS